MARDSRWPPWSGVDRSAPDPALALRLRFIPVLYRIGKTRFPEEGRRYPEIGDARCWSSFPNGMASGLLQIGTPVARAPEILRRPQSHSAEGRVLRRERRMLRLATMRAGRDWGRGVPGPGALPGDPAPGWRASQSSSRIWPRLIWKFSSLYLPIFQTVGTQSEPRLSDHQFTYRHRGMQLGRALG